MRQRHLVTVRLERARESQRTLVDRAVAVGDTATIPRGLEASKRGVRPFLAGYVAGATWPLYQGGGQSFVGLMHAADRSAGTVIVAFADVPGPTPATVLARLPMRFETLSITPDLHGPDHFVYLESLSDGVRRHVVLRLGADTARDIISRVKRAPRPRE